MTARSSTRLYSLLVAGSTMLGWWLRLPLWDRFPFRADEAIYSYWALHFWQVDPFFLHVWPDKPPVFLVALVGAFQLWGANQTSAHWLNLAISTLTIPVVAALAQHLWGCRAGIVAALALALNPFAISFAATAYTDPLLVLTGLLALYFALAHQPFWAGLWLALAIMTKQQGLLYTPLVAGSLLYHRQLRQVSNGSHAPLAPPFTLYHFLLGLALITLPVLYWDSRRWAVAPSPWDLSIRHYGALTLLPPDHWLARLTIWLPLVWHLTASWWVWLGLLGLFLCAGWERWGGVSQEAERPDFVPTWSVGTRKLLASLSPGRLLCLWGCAFLGLHIFSSIQPWDRYLLPLAPLLALFMGWLAAHLHRLIAPRWWVSGLCAGLLLFLPPAGQAAQGRLPIGSDHGAYSGLVEAIEWVKHKAPSRLILYQQVLGWHYQFYLYEQMSRGAYDVRWFPNPVYLAGNAAQAPGRPRLLIEPDWAAARELGPRLAQRGLAMERLAHFGHFTIYQLREERADFCRWCFCEPRFQPIPLTSAADPVMMSLR